MKRKRKYEREISSVDYIEGVKGCDGSLAIRPLNQEELEFLKKFNDEYVGGNFQKTDNLHDSLIEKNIDKTTEIKNNIQQLKLQLKELSSSFKKTWKKTQKIIHSDKRNALKEQIEALKEELLKYDVKGNIWKDRYAKRMDMYHSEVMNVSDFFSDEEFKSESEMFDAILSRQI